MSEVSDSNMEGASLAAPAAPTAPAAAAAAAAAGLTPAAQGQQADVLMC